MRTSKRRFVGVVCGAAGYFLAPSAFAQSTDGEGDEARPLDTQLRAQLAITAPLYKKLRLTLRSDLRLASRTQDDRFTRGEIGLIYSHPVNPHLTLEPRYRYRATDEFFGPTQKENRFSLNAKLEWEVGSFTLSDSNLLEYRLRGRGAETRYRNHLRLTHPLRAGDGKTDLFVADEVYYDWGDNAWSRNRFRIGVTRPLSRLVELEVHYLREWNKFSRPGRLDALGIVMQIDLGED